MSKTVQLITINASPFAAIKKIHGKEEIVNNHSDYIVDESKLAGGSAEWLFFPTSESEVVAIVNRMRKENIPITISAGRTGIVGSAVPFDGAVMSTENMSSILGLGYDQELKKYFIRLQPGITLQNLENFIKYRKFTPKHNLFDGNWVEKFQQDSTSYIFPVDPTEMTATVGGSIAANASGARSFKYGAMRAWVRRMRIVLYTGEILDIKRGQYTADNGRFVIRIADKDVVINIPTYQMPKAKNAAGLYAEPRMDLIEFFIGSEGLFGVITEVDLWLTKAPNGLPNVMFFTSEEDSINFVQKLREDEQLSVEYIEFFDENSFNLLRMKQETSPALANLSTIPFDAKTAIFFEIPYTEETLEDIIIKLDEFASECNTSIDSCWSGFDEVERENFRVMRHAVPEIVNSIIAKRKNNYPDIHKLGTDMSVEHKYFPEMMKIYHRTLEQHQLEYVIWGHIGDSHVHVNILPRNMKELELGKEIYKKFAVKAVEFGGSVSAEHGIGKIKADYLLVMYGEEGVNQMKEVKKALDPKFLFNRGNMFKKQTLSRSRRH